MANESWILPQEDELLPQDEQADVAAGEDLYNALRVLVPSETLAELDQLDLSGRNVMAAMGARMARLARIRRHLEHTRPEAIAGLTRFLKEQQQPRMTFNKPTDEDPF